jgi:hypothetical protein
VSRGKNAVALLFLLTLPPSDHSYFRDGFTGCGKMQQNKEKASFRAEESV